MRVAPFFLLFFLTPFDAFAYFDDYVDKPYSIGLGRYASQVRYDDKSISDDEFYGFAASFNYVLSDEFAWNVKYFSLEHDINSKLKSRGFDLVAYIGSGMATDGLKGYIGGGIFQDKLTASSDESITIDGLQLSAGVGYNCKDISFDLILNARDADEYEDELGSEVSVITSTFQISYRFQ